MTTTIVSVVGGSDKDYDGYNYNNDGNSSCIDRNGDGNGGDSGGCDIGDGGTDSSGFDGGVGRSK